MTDPLGVKVVSDTGRGTGNSIVASVKVPFRVRATGVDNLVDTSDLVKKNYFDPEPTKSDV